MPADLPPWAIEEERFADWCASQGCDETDAAWVLYEQWMEGDRD